MSMSNKALVVMISIHVPLRGTTVFFACCWQALNNFNPRPLAGDDTVLNLSSVSLNNFNPRPLAGDDIYGYTIR